MFILLKTENNNKNNKKVIVHYEVIVYMPWCTVHVPWTVHQTLAQKKKLKRVCKPKPLYSPLTIILQVNWVLVILLKTENNNKNN